MMLFCMHAKGLGNAAVDYVYCSIDGKAKR